MQCGNAHFVGHCGWHWARTFRKRENARLDGRELGERRGRLHRCGNHFWPKLGHDLRDVPSTVYRQKHLTQTPRDPELKHNLNFASQVAGERNARRLCVVLQDREVLRVVSYGRGRGCGRSRLSVYEGRPGARGVSGAGLREIRRGARGFSVRKSTSTRLASIRRGRGWSHF